MADQSHNTDIAARPASTRLLNAFRVRGQLSVPIVLVFVCINLLVAIDITLHPVLVGYDAADHLAYVETLATKGLPTEADTLEYFSAPLPYVFPAVLHRCTSNETHTAAAQLLVTVVLTCLAGYLGFLIMFPSPGKGDTIKATYVLHIFPLIAVLVGLGLAQIARTSRGFYLAIVVALVAVFVHNLPVYITHFSAETSALFTRTYIDLQEPAPRSHVCLPVEIRGTVRAPAMRVYYLWLGQGTHPTEWTWLSGPHSEPVQGGVLTPVKLDDLSPGPYVLRITVELEDGCVAERYVPFTIESNTTFGATEPETRMRPSDSPFTQSRQLGTVTTTLHPAARDSSLQIIDIVSCFRNQRTCLCVEQGTHSHISGGHLT